MHAGMIQRERKSFTFACMPNDTLYMRRCIELARNGMADVAPNPMVGCVIVRNDKVLGEGYHTAFGKAHAEVEAMQKVAPDELKGATLYVNLEPCAHHGKTPPCANTIVDAGIGRVVVGMTDPNPLVAGKGLNILRQAGIEVETGCLEDECLWLNRRFVTRMTQARPYIILKWAQSADGFLGVDDDRKLGGEPFWISSHESRFYSHTWRREEMAILVGSGTVLADDPQLTVREVTGANPVRIVLDRRGRLTASHKVFDNSAPTLLFSSVQPQGAGKQLEWIQAKPDQLLAQVCDVCREKNIQSVIVEGGAQILQAFFDAQLWDEVRVFNAPGRLGTGIPAPLMAGRPHAVQQVGADELFVYYRIPV